MASEKHLVRTPDIPELRAFCAAADLGTLGRAAVRLQISQPALSKRLRGLEAVAGTTLLERSSSGVTLTAAGRRLYPEARRLLDQAEIVEGLLASARSEPDPIRLAASHTIAEFHLPGELVTYHADGARHAPVELTIANSVAVRRMVAEGRANIGITAADPNMADHDDLEVFHLLDDEVVVAVPAEPSLGSAGGDPATAAAEHAADHPRPGGARPPLRRGGAGRARIAPGSAAERGRKHRGGQAGGRGAK